MNPQLRNLMIADGQLGTSAGVIASGPHDWAVRLNLNFTNVGNQTETIVLTFSRGGGVPRQLRQVALDPGESFELCGLPCNKADSVSAQTTDAASVDYLVSLAPDDAPLASHVYDATGLPKHNPQILEQLAAVLG